MSKRTVWMLILPAASMLLLSGTANATITFLPLRVRIPNSLMKICPEKIEFMVQQTRAPEQTGDWNIGTVTFGDSMTNGTLSSNNSQFVCTYKKTFEFDLNIFAIKNVPSNLYNCAPQGSGYRCKSTSSQDVFVPCPSTFRTVMAPLPPDDLLYWEGTVLSSPSSVLYSQPTALPTYMQKLQCMYSGMAFGMWQIELLRK